MSEEREWSDTLAFKVLGAALGFCGGGPIGAHIGWTIGGAVGEAAIRMPPAPERDAAWHAEQEELRRKYLNTPESTASGHG